MLHADKKEKARKTTPAGRINTPEDTIAKSFAPPPMFGEQEDAEKEEEFAMNGEELSATEKIKSAADKKKKKKGL